MDMCIRMEVIFPVELIVSNGRYVCDDRGNPVGATGSEETLARILFKLTARRGEFPLLPNLGSRLYRLGSEKKASRHSTALGYVAEALADEAGIDISDVKVSEEKDGICVTVFLTSGGEDMEISVVV